MANGHLMSEIARMAGGEATLPLGDHRIEHLSIDTRGTLPAEGTLFIALKGHRHDGHRYVQEMVQRGVRDVIVDGAADTTGLNTIVVPDTLRALQQLAAQHRARFYYPVVGITGSNGKTVVKEWLYQCLREDERVVRSPGSWNSQVGVPLSVWEMGARHTIALIEAGVSRAGEMRHLAEVVRPTIGVFTNVGPAHAAGFEDDVRKAREKALLFQGSEVVVHRADHAIEVDALRSVGLGGAALARNWGRSEGAWVRVLRERVVGPGTELDLQVEGRDLLVRIPFNDAASVENALHVVTVLLHLGHAPEEVLRRVAALEPVAMRLEMVAAVGGGVLINDAYSSDPASLAMALDHLVRHSDGRQRVAVIGDIQGAGLSEEGLYGRVADRLRHAGVDQVLAVGPAITAHRTALPEGTRFFPDAAALLRAHPVPFGEGAIVLVKGARELGLERVVEHWQERVHGTVLEVDMSAVRDNLNHYRSVIGPEVRVMAMVKADAYGMGAVALSRLFAHERVAYLGAAYVDEGVELRRKGVRIPVLVMNPEPMPFDLLHRYQLETEVYDERSLRAAIAYARQVPDAPPVHIELDTGMRRLGFPEDEWPLLADLLRDAGPLRVASIMSHLAGADEERHDEFTRQQVQRFAAGADRVSEVLGTRPLRHIANSAGAVRFPEARMDMVRLGIGLHGVGVRPEEERSLRPVASLRTVVAQVREVPVGGSVSYDRTFVAQRPTRLAVLPIGYADGLARRLSNGRGRVRVHGRAAPFAGIICMDMCMVDVTDIPCAVGDPAIVFGPEHPVQEYARDLATIPYEALTSISPRVRRVYVRE